MTSRPWHGSKLQTVFLKCFVEQRMIFAVLKKKAKSCMCTCPVRMLQSDTIASESCFTLPCCKSCTATPSLADPAPYLHCRTPAQRHTRYKRGPLEMSVLSNAAKQSNTAISRHSASILYSGNQARIPSNFGALLALTSVRKQASYKLVTNELYFS